MFNKIIIFSGTTEGRELSSLLSDAGVKHIVSVASEYGQNMMEANECADVHVGRMEADEMIAFMQAKGFDNESIIIDASHPYATLLSENIQKAAMTVNAKIVRVYRNSVSLKSVDNIVHYDDVLECAEALDRETGNILLTTGSKELNRICSNASQDFMERLYVRVLPAIESIELCKAAGVLDKNIIAMHGPFTTAMNEALIKQYDIKHLVTKDSGTNGGFIEKAEAARSSGCKCHVIDRPVLEEGISVFDAYELITGVSLNRKLKINLVGAGMGSDAILTGEAKSCIENSDAIFGAERLIAGINNRPVYDMYLARDIIPVLEKHGEYLDVTILFSGDTGFYSGAKKMHESLAVWSRENDIDAIINVSPGVSSVAYLAAKLGENYDDAFIYSLHGRGDVWQLVNACKYNRKCYSLLSGSEDVKKISSLLAEQSVNAKIYCGYNLSYENEKIVMADLNDGGQSDYSEPGIVTVLIVNDNPKRKPVINIKRDEDFIRDKVPMTKECIRHESIIKLGLMENDVVYDIGAGTGSVAIEIAGLSNTLKVYAIEKKPEAVELLKQNIAKHNAHNIELVEGNALDRIKGLEKPDAVFIGGSSGELEEIIDYLASRKSDIRVVINAVSLETISEINSIITSHNIENVNIMQLAVSNVNGIGNYHLMQAQNPVMIFAFSI